MLLLIVAIPQDPSAPHRASARSRSPAAADLRMRSASVLLSTASCVDGGRQHQASCKAVLIRVIVSGSKRAAAFAIIASYAVTTANRVAHEGDRRLTVG